MKRFFLGFGFVVTGVDLLKQHKELRKWAVIPWIIDVILLIIGVKIGGKLISKGVVSALGIILPPDHTLYPILYYPLVVLFWLGFLGLLIYALYLIAGIVASPFNSILAERTLAMIGAKRPEGLSIERAVALAWRMFLVSLARSVILLVVGVLVFFASFLPGLNFFAIFFAFLVICFDGADYSFEVLQMKLSERFAFLRDNLPEFLGMASFVGLTLLVPGLILLLMPAAVVGCAYVIHRIRMRAGG